MKFFSNLLNKVENKAAQKLTDATENLVSQGIDQTAAKAAQVLGRQFGNPTPFNNQQVIENYRTNQPVEYLNPQQVVQPVQQQIPQMPMAQPDMYQQQFSNPFLYPNFQQAQLGFNAHVINKLEEEQVKRLALYKTNMFFQINNIGKNTIRFIGLKFFSYNLEQSRQVVKDFEDSQTGDLKAYKKAKYKLAKVEELEAMKDDAEQEKIFRDFVADVILDELKQKNERGELQMPTTMDIAIQQFGFHAWRVFSPDLSLEAFLGI